MRSVPCRKSSPTKGGLCVDEDTCHYTKLKAFPPSFSPVSECIQKFGEKDGQEVWEATNRAFDAMPIAAVIDKKVFACVLVTVRVYWCGGMMVGGGGIYWWEGVTGMER